MLCRKCKMEMPDKPFCPDCGTRQEKAKRKAKTRGNGTGSVYRRGDSLTYTAAYKVGEKIVKGRKRPIMATQGGFVTKKDGYAFLESLSNRKDGRKPGIKTLGSYWDVYKTGKYMKLSANTQSGYKTAQAKWGDIFTRDIRELTIKDLLDRLNEKASSYETAKDMQSVLSHCYQLAIAEQVVGVNLARHLTLPDNDPEESIPFTDEEIDKLWKAYSSGDKMAGYALLMIYSGMMPGELLKAKKNMIDWDKQLIIGAGLKTKKRKKTPIVIADFMLPVLQDLCDYSEKDNICYCGASKFYAEFPEMLKRCGCRPELAPYSCRHTTATLSALNNVAQATLLEIMRQKKFTTTQRYIHIDVTKSLEAINMLKERILKENAADAESEYV